MLSTNSFRVSFLNAKTGQPFVNGYLLSPAAFRPCLAAGLDLFLVNKHFYYFCITLYLLIRIKVKKEKSSMT